MVWYKVLTFSQTIVNHLWFGMDIQAAVNYRRLHHQLFPMAIMYEEEFNSEIDVSTNFQYEFNSDKNIWILVFFHYRGKWYLRVWLILDTISPFLLIRALPLSRQFQEVQMDFQEHLTNEDLVQLVSLNDISSLLLRKWTFKYKWMDEIVQTMVGDALLFLRISEHSVVKSFSQSKPASKPCIS